MNSTWFSLLIGVVVSLFLYLGIFKKYQETKALEKKNRADKDRQVREDMLRTLLTRASLEKFKEIVEKLGWVRKDADGNWRMFLPREDYASSRMVGAVFGNISKNREEWKKDGDISGLTPGELVNEVIKTYKKRLDIDDFVKGVENKIENAEDTLSFQGRVASALAQNMGRAEKEEIEEIISAGMDASDINLQED